MESHFTTCAALVHTLLDALSLALQVPAPGLAPTHAASAFQLRLLHYPALNAADLKDGRRARIGAHSDFGTLTLLFQDCVGGLQVERPGRRGDFVDVVPVPGAVLVNVGDLMARWSNGRWKSTVHRVGLPAGGAGGDGGDGGVDSEGIVPERYSVPFFATADMDTVIEALPGCWGEGRPKLYEPVTAWDYVQMRMAALYE
jgi:isopenicillin N synthase-like dioxygenase